SYFMARKLLASGGTPAWRGLAPICASGVAELRLGTRTGAVRRRVQAILRHFTGADTEPGNGITLRRRNRYGELLPDLVTRQSGSGPRDADPSHFRRRSASLQAFLPVFSEIPGHRESAAHGDHSGAVPAPQDDRRRRQLYRPQACPRRALSRRTL